MNNFPSPFAGLMVPDFVEDADTPKSLLDLINSHNSLHESSNDEDVSSLTDLTSNLLKVDTDAPTEESLSSLPSCLGNLMIVGDSTVKESSNCDTLEAYAKSFLNAKGNDISPFRKPAPPPNFNIRVLKTENDATDLKQIDERLRSMRVDDEPRKEGTRKIDLTAALQSRSESNSTSHSTKIPNKTKQSVFTYPVQKCNIDLSSLADENLLYGSSSLSPFGYVVSRKWNRVILPKKYRRLERIRPYNVARSFKFDVPSPDDCAAKNRKRNISFSDT